MSRRHPRSGSSWTSLPGANVLSERADEIDRASVVGSAPIVAGTGFVLSRAVAIVIANASGLSFLWGLVIGLAFATAGVVVFASTETDIQSHHPGVRRSKQQIPFATAGGVLLLSLLTGIVLGAVL
jgi:hypothetical protein